MQDLRSFSNRDDLEISFYERSGKTPVLLIPGFGCNYSTFLPMIPHFSEQFNLIAIDNRGMGFHKNVKKRYQISDLANDCTDLMNHLGHEKFHVVGTSMGGFVAQVLMTSFKERILSSSLLCTTSNHDEFIPIKIYSADELKAFDLFPLEEGMKLSTEKIVHDSLIKENEKQFLEIVNLRSKHKANIDQLLWQRDAVDSFFSSDAQKVEFEKISTPTLLMSGDSDSFVNPGNIEVFKDKIAGSCEQLIEETDHLFFMEKPSAVVSSIENFWESL